MQTDRSVFIQALFRLLSEVEYLWLKALPARPEDTPGQSDIDLLVKENDLPSVLSFISKQAALTRCEATQKESATYLQLEFQDGTQLRLDLLTALVRKQFTYLPNRSLFANRVWKDGVVTYQKKVMLEHVLLFNFLNHAGLPPKYVQHFVAMPGEEQVKLIGFVNAKYATGFADFQQMAVFTKSARQQFLAYLKQQPENSFTARTQQSLRYLAGQFGSKKTPLPRVITFTGVDGAGKSTLLSDLKSVLSEKLGQRVVTLRHRPSLLPILSAYTQGKQAAQNKAATTLPRQGSNNSTFSSLLRFGYYYMDFFFGQIYVWLRYTLPGYTLIYDRYYFDFIVDGKRSNISLGEALPKWLYRFVTKPDINIFLYAAPDIIRQRKQELPTEDIERMTGQYLALFEELGSQYYGKYISIENHDRQTTLDTILAHYFSGANGDASPINQVAANPNPLSFPEGTQIVKPKSPVPC